MSQKAEKPTLSGQRLKTRKRGKKIKNVVWIICIQKGHLELHVITDEMHAITCF